MTTTYFENIDELIESLQRIKKDYEGCHVLMTNSWHGPWNVPTEKHPFYKMSFGMNGELLKKDDVRNFSCDESGAIVLAFIPKELFDESRIKDMHKRDKAEVEKRNKQ